MYSVADKKGQKVLVFGGASPAGRRHVLLALSQAAVGRGFGKGADAVDAGFEVVDGDLRRLLDEEDERLDAVEKGFRIVSA